MSLFLTWARCAGQVGFLLALAVYGAACSGNAALSAGDTPSAGGAPTGGSGGQAGTGQPLPVLTLSILDEQGKWTEPGPDATVTRTPHQETLVQVHASDGERTVRFALLPNDLPVTSGGSMPGDAALDETDVATDAYGLGDVLLTAPGNPTTFLLRASAGTLASAQLRFSVQQMNLARLEVVPLYAGTRPITTWTASATPGKTCSELMGTPPPDGEYSGTGEDAVFLPDVPVGVPLAVLVRAEQFAWGCTNLASAVEGSTPDRVEIVVSDVQIRLDESRVDLVLSLDSLDGWRAALDGSLATLKEALGGEAEDDVEALLDAMEAALDGSDRTDFSSTRGTERWDERVREVLGETAATTISSSFERWLNDGLAGLEPVGALSGRVSPEATGSALLVLDSAFGLSPVEAGFTTPGRGPWYAEADNVLIGLTLDFRPAAFLVAAARTPAVAEVPDSDGIADVLATLVPCSTVADALIGYSDCQGKCAAEELCHDALEAMVERAATADIGVATLLVAANGQAGVGPTATLKDLAGSWIGELSFAEEKVDVSGAATAVSAD